MRSGNLPARFETTNLGYYSKLVAGASGNYGAALGSGDTTMFIQNAQYWPSSGWVIVQDASSCEMIRYTGIGAYNATAKGYPLTGLTRRTTYTQAGISAAGVFSTSAYTLGGNTASVTFTPDGGSGGAGIAPVSVQYAYNNCAAIVSHWGVSVIMDGRYDDDKQYIFTAGMNRYLNIAAGATRPLLALRIAPSVDSGNGRNFGIREIINRMQLTLAQIGILSQGQFLIEGILNPFAFAATGITLPTSWQSVPVGSGSLAQVLYFNGTNVYATTGIAANGTFSGGDKIFAFYTNNSGGTTNFNTTTYDLDKVRDLGTSILSGDGNAINPSYPNAPDVLLITARNIAASGTANLACRLGWTEAQA
jgi:hypothetical protein